MMVYQRPVFRVISLLRIRNREEAKLVLIGAVVVYRNFVEQTLADAQKNWVKSLVLYDDPGDAVTGILTWFSRYACLHGPRLGPLDTIAVNDNPLYIYCPRRKLEEYAKERIVSFHSEIGSVVCSMSPFDAGVTREKVRYGHNLISPGSCLLPDALEAYVAFLPSKSFLKLPYSVYEVHNDRYVHKFFALLPGSRFHFEVVAVGLAYPAAKKRPSGLGILRCCSTGKTNTCL
uniref:D protein n=1 Tax=Agrobacterium tumefaciens TaxID=358 RepID=A0A2Z2PQC0_AGRTU|nr:RolB family protein [Agrobacterium tumefaciens]ASK44381.1 D protein [Agrobacterium tumefaciens]